MIQNKLMGRAKLAVASVACNVALVCPWCALSTQMFPFDWRINWWRDWIAEPGRDGSAGQAVLMVGPVRIVVEWRSKKKVGTMLRVIA